MIHCVICIDDTDNLDSIGTGEHADMIVSKIIENQWGTASRVTRHQLFVHEDIPYTSHNSSMCFEAHIKTGVLDELTVYIEDYLKANHAQGSDPGFCLVNLNEFKAVDSLIAFGQKAKKQVLTKEEAYEFARLHDIHLSEHGGTGLGVIGSLAGAGLRLSGNDGRFRGKMKLDVENMSVADLKKLSIIDDVQTIDGLSLANEDLVDVRGNVKTVYLNHQSILLVTETGAATEVRWKMIQKERLKNY